VSLNLRVLAAGDADRADPTVLAGESGTSPPANDSRLFPRNFWRRDEVSRRRSYTSPAFRQLIAPGMGRCLGKSETSSGLSQIERCNRRLRPSAGIALCAKEKGVGMQRLEPALAAFEEKIAEAQKAADTFAKALKRLKSAASTGHIADLERTLATIAERGEEAAAVAASLTGAWDFPTADYLAKGYADELRDEATGQSIKLFERDGRLYAFPLL
jgi:hypothetical protein